jgi:hypothetical protein
MALKSILSSVFEGIKTWRWFRERKDKHNVANAERDALAKRDELRDFLGPKDSGGD